MSFSYRSGTKSNFSSKPAPANKKVVADDMNDIADELNRLDLVIDSLISNSGVADKLSGLDTATNNTYYGKDRDGINSGFLRSRDLGEFTDITQRDNYSSPQQGDICTVATQATSLFVYDGSSWIRLSPLDGAEVYNELTDVLGGSYWVTAGTSYLGDYTDLSALQTAHPTGQSDEYALVGTTGNRTFYVWNGSNWIDSTDGPNGLYMTKAEYASNTHPGEVDTANLLNLRDNAGAVVGSITHSVGPVLEINSTNRIDLKALDRIRLLVERSGSTLWFGSDLFIITVLGSGISRIRDSNADDPGAIAVDSNSQRRLIIGNQVKALVPLRLDSATSAQVPTPLDVQEGQRIAAIDGNTGELVPRILKFPSTATLDVYATYGSYTDFNNDRANIPNGSIVEIWNGSEFVISRTGTSPGNTYQINITATNGSVTKSPDQSSYSLGSTVILTPVANTGYIFSQWGDGAIDNPRSVVVNGNLNFTALFAIAQLTASFEVLFSSNGVVELNWIGTGEPVRADINWGNGQTNIINDGSNPMDPRPTHTYASGGDYTISLTLTDINGNSSTSFKTIEVAPFN